MNLKNTLGLCASCKHVKEIKHPRGGQSYWQCTSTQVKTKYPRLPVVTCLAYQKKSG